MKETGRSDIRSTGLCTALLVLSCHVPFAVNAVKEGACFCKHGIGRRRPWRMHHAATPPPNPAQPVHAGSHQRGRACDQPAPAPTRTMQYSMQDRTSTGAPCNPPHHAHPHTLRPRRASCCAVCVRPARPCRTASARARTRARPPPRPCTTRRSQLRGRARWGRWRRAWRATRC